MTANAYGFRLLRQPRVRLVVLTLLAGLVVVFRALQFAAFTRQVQWGYDFSFYWTAAAHLLHGEPIYSAAQLAGPYAPQGQDGFLYPPPLAAAVMPLATLFPTDFKAAAWAWTGVGAVVLAWVVLALHRSERLGERFAVLEGRGRWLLVAAAFAFPPVIGELVMGNVHLLLLGLLALAWLGLRRAEEQAGGPGAERGAQGGAQRRAQRAELLAGVAVGVAAVIKVFPGLLLLWFLLTRRFRASIGVLIGVFAAVLVALPFTGLEPWRQFPTVLANLSAPSDTTDTLAPTVWLMPALGFTLARVVITAAGLAIVAWSAFRLSPAGHDYPTGITTETSTPAPLIAPAPLTARARLIDPARSFAIAVTVSVLIAPALYHHYLALLVLPFLLALGAGVPLRWLALAYFLMWGGDQPALGDLAWIVNRALPTAGALVLLGALALPPFRSISKAARREPDPQATSQPS